MSEVVSVYAVFADPAEAQRIGRQMIGEGLAACVNILGPCRSIYRWEGAVESSTEAPALFKTTAAAAHTRIARVSELHGYNLPAVVAWPIAHAAPAFAQWIVDNVTAETAHPEE